MSKLGRDAIRKAADQARKRVSSYPKEKKEWLEERARKSINGKTREVKEGAKDSAS